MSCVANKIYQCNGSYNSLLLSTRKHISINNGKAQDFSAYIYLEIHQMKQSGAVYYQGSPLLFLHLSCSQSISRRPYTQRIAEIFTMVRTSDSPGPAPPTTSVQSSIMPPVLSLRPSDWKSHCFTAFSSSRCHPKGLRAVAARTAVPPRPQSMRAGLCKPAGVACPIFDVNRRIVSGVR